MPAPLPTTTLTTAHDILAGRWFLLTDKPAYIAEVTAAAQCALDGDDTDLRWHIAEADAQNVADSRLWLPADHFWRERVA